MKKVIVLSTVALLVGLSACAEQRAATMQPGTYESKSMKVDSNGTEYDSTSKTKVTVDADGNRTVVMDNQNSTDPKGLFNKKTTKSKKVITTAPSDDDQ